MLIKVFLVKILIAYLYAFIHFENGWRDTFQLFLSGKTIASLFLDHPDLYFEFVFGKVQEPFSPEIQKIIGNDVLKKYGTPRSDFLVRLNAVLIPFCYGYYSVLCIFYEFLSLLGIFYIYDFITRSFGRNNLLKLFLFFAPSILFWLSGLHKDAMTIFGLGLVLFSIQKILANNHKYFIVLILGVVFSYLVRNYALFIFIPPLIAYLFTQKMSKYVLIPYLIIYSTAVLFFFGGKLVHPKLNFPERFVEYQNGFSRLNGGSTFELNQLEPTIESFAESVPIALFNTLLKPNFQTSHTFWSALAAIENIFYVICFLFIIPFINLKRYVKQQKALIIFFLLYGLSYFLTLGLIVDNLGAIVRYKSIPLVFLGSALILIFDQEKLKRFIKLNNRFNKK